MTDFKEKIVRKPWGYEYLMYENEKIGVWYLHIMQGRQTSLHCHPTKKTGYILLSGEARVSFLNDSIKLKAVSKLMLREGLFHSTQALSPEGIDVIEVESPPDKTSLVRLEDAYGRKSQPYEGLESTMPMTDSCIILKDPERGRMNSYRVGGLQLVLERFDDVSPLRERVADEIMLVLDGGLFSKDQDPIVSPGDVVTTSTFNRLAETFSASQGVALMSVRTPPQSRADYAE
jgi:mannose-6-phosphate isomerase-like protein (cupin superfamily)